MLQTLTIDMPRPNLMATPADISNFENKFNVTLPVYLKDFILAYGGQGVEEEYYVVSEFENGKMDFIFPLNYWPGNLSIESLTDGLLRIKGEVKYIPFAYSNTLTLFVKIVGDDAGDIYYFMNGHDDENLLQRFENFTFESLINSLTSVDLDDLV